MKETLPFVLMTFPVFLLIFPVEVYLLEERPTCRKEKAMDSANPDEDTACVKGCHEDDVSK